ncbi:hypothetical protein MLD38_013302 [Melastoma candidum]|uniref:Uncharacterized protein n=1 Tax=Melastoma candidum TaxID=119954 RepID=A0ACB9RAF4_9MYRT|nr:hypothetical protein MLD38_013302 [Melastoma candidum]
MEASGCQNGGGGIMWFFRDRGFDDKSINDMFSRCKRLESVQREWASTNWDYLRSIGIEDRKVPHVISKCPKVLMLGLDDKLIPMVECLGTLC